jgi:uncharacterized membrane protein
MSARWFIAALTLAFFAPTAPSLADFRVCNQSKEQIDVAFGYEGGRNMWIAEGWWTIKHGKCATVWSGPLRNRYYYLYAEGDKGTEWDASEGDKGSSFCVKSEKFKLDQRKYGSSDEDECQKHGLESKLFFEVDVSNYDSWTHTLDPAVEAAAPAPNPNPPQGAPAPKPAEGSRPGGSACERYPNLC